MKKTVTALLCTLVMLLTGCAGGAQIESLRGWYFQDNPGSNDYSVFFGLLDEDDQEISASADVDIRIVNENDEQVYEGTKSVTPDDFGTYTSEAHGEEYLAEIRIPKEDIAGGTSANGTAYLKVYQEGKFEFDEVNCKALYCLPTQDIKLETEPLPVIIGVKNLVGNAGGKIQIDDVSYTVETGVSNTLNVTVFGQKLEGTDGLSYDMITYKLYDSEGYMVESGQLYLDELSAGDKFRDDSIMFFDVVPGETYTLQFSEYEL